MSEKKKVLSVRIIILLLIFIVLIPISPLLITQQWDWWEAWVYAVVSILGFAFSRLAAGYKNPDLLEERSQFLKHSNPEPWDKVLSPLLGVFGAMVPITAGLDARFGTPVQFSLAFRLIALTVMLVGYAIGSYALYENRFFSGMVRIQSERNHHPITTGPYRWVRHPGYAGSLLYNLATPFLLESLWTFIPVALSVLVLVLRTALEDQVLQDKLEGYKDYAKVVKHRLIPGVW